MKAYLVKYRTYMTGEEKEIEVLARSAAEAYEKAMFELIPARDGALPYSAWVQSVTFSNGRVHYFNTCEGLAY